MCKISDNWQVSALVFIDFQIILFSKYLAERYSVLRKFTNLHTWRVGRLSARGVGAVGIQERDIRLASLNST